MKYLLTICFIFFFSSGKCQKKYYGVAFGYGFNLQKNSIGQSIRGSETTIDGEAYNKDYISSLGNGIYLNLNFGFSIDSISYFEVGFQTFQASEASITTYIYKTSPQVSPYYFARNTINTHGIFFNPKYVISLPLKRKTVINIKSGLLIGQCFISSENKTQNFGYFLTPAREIKTEFKYKTAITYGFTSDINFLFPIRKNMYLSNTLFFQLAGSKLKSRHIESYAEDGIDKINTIPSSERTTTFHSGKNRTLSGEELNSKSTATVLPLSSFGITVGITFLLDN